MILIFIILGVIFLLVLYFIITKKRISHLTISTDEAQAQIDQLLNKKNELLISINKKIMDKYDILDGVDGVSYNCDNIYQYHDFLSEYYSNLYKLFHSDDFIDDELKNDKKFCKLISLIKEEEQSLVACIKYYNDKAFLYNDFISKFPINLVSAIFRFKKLKSFNIDKKEKFNIFK